MVICGIYFEIGGIVPDTAEKRLGGFDSKARLFSDISQGD